MFTVIKAMMRFDSLYTNKITNEIISQIKSTTN